MANKHDRKLNDIARETGKTRAQLADEVRDALFGEPKGLRKWVELAKSSLRRPTAIDRENRRIFEENEASSQADKLRKLKSTYSELADRPAEGAGYKER